MLIHVTNFYCRLFFWSKVAISVSITVFYKCFSVLSTDMPGMHDCSIDEGGLLMGHTHSRQ